MRRLSLAEHPYRDAMHIDGMVVIACDAAPLPPLALDAFGPMPQLLAVAEQVAGVKGISDETFPAY